MTYRELLEELRKMTAEQLDCDIALYSGCRDEFYGDNGLHFEHHEGVLDEGHPVIAIKD